MRRNLPSIIAGALLAAILILYMITYQVRFNQCAIVRTFGQIRQPGLLFSIPGRDLEELDEARLPPSLGEALRQGKAALEDAATVTVKQRGNEWRISDARHAYLLRKMGNRLDVFDPRQRESRDVILREGFYLKWPWPIQRVNIYDNRIQMASTPDEEMPTKDAKNLILTTSVCWRIADPYLFTIRCLDMNDAENKLRTRVRNDQKTVIAQYDFGNFVSIDPRELRYDEIEAKILETVRPSAKELYGIEVAAVWIEKLALPGRITETVFEAMRKERQVEAAQYTSEGTSGAKKIRDEAEAVAGTILSFAERKAAEIVAEGLGRAAQYNETLRQDEPLAMFLLKLEYLPKILEKRTTLFFEDQPPFDLLAGPRQGAAATQPAGRRRRSVTEVLPEPNTIEVK